MPMDPCKRYTDLSNQLMRVLVKEFKMPPVHGEELKTLETCTSIVQVQGTKAECERGCAVLVALLNCLHPLVPK